MDPISVYVTCPSEEVAAAIARALVERRLVACANILPGARSIYRWEGSIEDEREVVMMMKTRRALFAEVEREVRARHPYEVPCIVALPLAAGSSPFLAWVDECTSST